MGEVTIYHGDCLDVLRAMPEASVDAVVTDPPYHLTSIVRRSGKEGSAPAKSDGATGVYAHASAGFMGKEWDGGDVAFRPETWAAVMRTMKPGAYLAAFASTRGYHRMACAVEDAGFIIHPMLGWIFGVGFPKATRVRAEGWEGWRYGLQALKPALEPILLAQVPFQEKTGTAQVLATGTGAINVDASRVATGAPRPLRRSDRRLEHNTYSPGLGGSRAVGETTAGRWPPNVLHDGSPEVLEAFGRFGADKGGGYATRGASTRVYDRGKGLTAATGETVGYGDAPGTAARFFPALGFTDDELRFHYSGKAGKADRAGSRHPCIKPQSLLRWLSRLICPPGGTILDPFAGSGSLGTAAISEGFNAILIEREPEYVADIKARLARMQTAKPAVAPSHPDLFADEAAA